MQQQHKSDQCEPVEDRVNGGGSVDGHEEQGIQGDGARHSCGAFCGMRCAKGHTGGQTRIANMRVVLTSTQHKLMRAYSLTGGQGFVSESTDEEYNAKCTN